MAEFARLGMPYKVFLSSPGDVERQRDLAVKVVAGINADEPGGDVFEIIDWRKQGLSAADSFQRQIEWPSRCDLVICIVHKRAGSTLGEDQYVRQDGSMPTGTEWEFENAMDRARVTSPKTPDIYVYRRMSDLRLPARDPKGESRRQFDRLEQWFKRWSESEDGNYTGAYHRFNTNRDFEVMLRDHLKQFLDRRRDEVKWTKGSPFRGLAAYEEDHNLIFFGRALEVERVRARLIANMALGCHFLMLTGPSGSGKSSLVRAGLVPRLLGPSGVPDGAVVRRLVVRMSELMDVAGTSNWRRVLAEKMLVPDAFGTAMAQGDFQTTNALSNQLAAEGVAAQLPFKRAHERQTSTGGVLLLLVLDQFEELLTWPDQAQVEFTQMLETLAVPHGLTVVATLRSDFAYRLSDLPALVRLEGSNIPRASRAAATRLNIARPSGRDLHDMIAGPAKAAGLRFEPGSDGHAGLQKVLEEEATPDALPAMQYLLSELYEDRADNILTRAAYNRLGGIAGAMASRGEAILDTLSERVGPARMLLAFNGLMRHLVGSSVLDVNSVARTVRENIVREREDQWWLLDALRNNGLLTSHKGNVRFAHESLLREWDTLRTFIQAERDRLETRSRLDAAAANHARKPEAARLLQGFDLDEGLALYRLWGPDAFDADDPLPRFIEMSRKRRLRRRGGVATAIASLTILAVGIVFYNQYKTNRNLELQLAQQGMSVARAAFGDKDWDRALLESANSYRKLGDSESLSLLARSILIHPPNTLAFRAGKYRHIDWASNGVLYALRYDGGIDAFRSDGKTWSLGRAPLEKGLNPAVLKSDDSGRLFAVLRNGDVVQVDASGDQKNVKILARVSGMLGGVVSSENDPVATRDNVNIIVRGDRIGVAFRTNDALRLMDCTSVPSLVCTVKERGGRHDYASLSPDGAWLAIVMSESSNVGLQIINLRNSEDVAITMPMDVHKGRPELRAWHPTENIFQASAGQDNGVSIHTIDANGQVTTQFTHNNIEADIYNSELKHREFSTWSADGDRVVDHKNGQWIPVYNVEKGVRSLSHYFINPYVVNKLLFVPSPTGHGFAELTDDGIRLWHSGSEAGLARPLGLDPRGAKRVFRAKDGIVQLSQEGANFTVDNGEEQSLASSSGNIALSPNDGLAVLTDDAKALVVFDRVEFLLRRCGAQPMGAVAYVAGETFAAAHKFDLGIALCTVIADGLSLQQIELAMHPSSDDADRRATALVGDGEGGLLAAISDGSIVHWDSRTGLSHIAVKAETVGDATNASTIVLHAAGRWVAVSRDDSIMRLFDRHTGKAGPSVPVRSTLSATETTVNVQFSPEGQWLSVVDGDKQVHLYSIDPTDGRLEKLFQIEVVKSDFYFSPRGKEIFNTAWWDADTLVIPNGSAPTTLLDITPDAWLERADEVRRGRTPEGFAKALAMAASPRP